MKQKNLENRFPQQLLQNTNKGGGVGWGPYYYVMHRCHTDLPSSKTFESINDSKHFMAFSYANSHCSPYCSIHSSCRGTNI